MELVPFSKEFEYQPQRRKAQATSTWKREQIAGADFETKDGYPHIFTWTVCEGNELVDRHFLFGGTAQEPDLFLEANGGKRHPAFDFKLFSEILFSTGNYSEGGHGKRKKPQEMWFFNLAYDANAMIKGLPQETITQLIEEKSIIIHGKTGELEPEARRISVDNPNYNISNNGQRKDKRKKIQMWVLGDRESYELLPFNTYIKLSYLPKKHFCIEPIKHYTKGVKWAKIDCWDIRPFLGGGSLNANAMKHFGEAKLDFTQEEMSLMGALTDEGVAFSVAQASKIVEYAEKDANLTARLAWKTVASFENNNVRMARPYSPASIAERACLDRCTIPTMNEMMEHYPEFVRAGWECYTGGWFESVGSGYHPYVRAFDITSAYPHVMWWLPDFTNGEWIGTFFDDPEDECWDYLDRVWTHYALSYFEAEVIFPEGLNIYPASKKSDVAGCLMNPRSLTGWFTGDEINEFRQWDAEIHIERWGAFVPAEGCEYPFRPFIETFYGGKLEQDKLKEAGDPSYDPEKRAINKLCANSCYGKLVQVIEGRTGQLWNPFYGSVITAGCRARMAEMIRINGHDQILAVNTDGLIFKADKELIMPENPMPVFFDGERINLGDWDEEAEGGLLLMMSGVYSILTDVAQGAVLKAKTTFRGSYSMFIDHRNDEGELKSDLYGEDWFTFCQRYGEEEMVERTAEINPAMRPYSLGEARIRNSFDLVNVFRVVPLKITACGDSNKRRWFNKPQTFGDLSSRWWSSETWEELI